MGKSTLTRKDKEGSHELSPVERPPHGFGRGKPSRPTDKSLFPIFDRIDQYALSHDIRKKPYDDKGNFLSLIPGRGLPLVEVNALLGRIRHWMATLKETMGATLPSEQQVSEWKEECKVAKVQEERKHAQRLFFQDNWYEIRKILMQKGKSVSLTYKDIPEPGSLQKPEQEFQMLEDLSELPLDDLLTLLSHCEEWWMYTWTLPFPYERRCELEQKIEDVDMFRRLDGFEQHVVQAHRKVEMHLLFDIEMQRVRQGTHASPAKQQVFETQFAFRLLRSLNLANRQSGQPDEQQEEQANNPFSFLPPFPDFGGNGGPAAAS